jgi:hypothetical protein
MPQHRAVHWQKIAGNDLEYAPQARLAQFGSVFRLFWG